MISSFFSLSTKVSKFLYNRQINDNHNRLPTSSASSSVSASVTRSYPRIKLDSRGSNSLGMKHAAPKLDAVVGKATCKVPFAMQAIADSLRPEVSEGALLTNNPLTINQPIIPRLTQLTPELQDIRRLTDVWWELPSVVTRRRFGYPQVLDPEAVGEPAAEAETENNVLGIEDGVNQPRIPPTIQTSTVVATPVTRSFTILNRGYSFYLFRPINWRCCVGYDGDGTPFSITI